MKTKTIKVFSYCEDFTEEEQELFQEASNDVYIEYTAYTKEWLEENGYENDIISNKLIELGCENNEKVLIHFDW